MLFLEVTCLAIVAIYLFFTLRVEPANRARFLYRMALVAASGWLCEETCIRWYGFYTYSDDWSIHVGSVPLMVLVIWPVVIDSSRRLAASASRRGLTAYTLAAGGLVFTDACLIEPVAVLAGLWQWHEPGIFAVPIAGILGWAFFAALCAAVFHANDSGVKMATADLALLPVTFLGTHLALLASWWGLLRWVNHTIPDAISTAFAWVAGLIVLVIAVRRDWGRNVELRTLLLRVPAVLFFLVLIGYHWVDAGWRIPYLCAFIPPYLVATWRASRTSEV